jgi:23S rRNA (cytosine1962-C5)-methyltransferase
MPYKVFLKKNEEKRLLAGHSWVYANEVARIEGKDTNGSLAEVYDAKDRLLGKGYINHASKILVRVFIRDGGEADKRLFLSRIHAANDYRVKLGYADCYRAVFAEADNLPALIVDKYGDTLSVQFLSLGMEKQKEMITECLREVFAPVGIYERDDSPARTKEGLPLVKDWIVKGPETRVKVTENGLSMIVDLENGQKTGYFLDQKENRYALRRYVRDADVLDCFCNSGGFSLNALAGGATRVTAVDISEQALSDARENAGMNGFSNRLETVCADVFELLRDYKKQGRSFDAIVLDPPAFCKSAAEAEDAYRGYKDINLLAMKLVRQGGFLATSSCSHFMSFYMFEKMLAEAARESGRTVRSVEIRSQSADHPSLLAAEETRYLKFYVLNIQ